MRNNFSFGGVTENLPIMGQRLSEDNDPDKEIDVAELQEWYKKFVVECPSGTLFMHEFKSFFGVTDNKEAADYIENMFRAFDKNGVSTLGPCILVLFALIITLKCCAHEMNQRIWLDDTACV